MLDHHANIFASDAEGGTPLHAASFHGNVAIIRQLLHAVSTTRQEKLLQAVDLAGNSALHLAVMGGHSRAADVLLRARANPNAQNKELNTPLHLAAHFDGEAFVALLLRWRAELGICNAVGMTPMHVVALYNRARVLRLLLNAGADADPHDEEGRTPLMLAAGKGHLEAVEILLDAGAKLISEDRMQ